MVKILLTFFLLNYGLFADNAYERNCVVCHENMPVSLQRMFMNYLLVYGGEKNLKAGLKHYLKYPSKHISVMSPLFIASYEIKEKTALSDKVLNESIDIYWEKFKVFNKLK